MPDTSSSPRKFPQPSYSIDSSLDRWNRSAKECLVREGKDKPWDGLATACIVFNPNNRILIIQRASNDSLPNKWELPGGAVDDEDPTVLYGAARELWEESGLLARHFSSLATQGPGRSEEETFSNRIKTKTFARYTFVVEVESCENVRLDPNEHQAYAWLSEQDVREERLDVTKEAVRLIVLEAFRLRRGPSPVL